MSTKPEKIDGLVKALMGSLAEGKPHSEDIQAAWRESIDAGLLKHTKISSFRAGRLLVLVDSSAWLYRASVSRNEILEKLNKQLSSNTVKKIDFKIG
ncbi:MAG: DUF721 domain-containing protein [Candidatus Omnitrophota bacterium]